MSNGNIVVGDIFKDGARKVLVMSFILEENDSFADVLCFNSKGLEKTDCINPLRLYDMKFLKNIMDVK